MSESNLKHVNNDLVHLFAEPDAARIRHILSDRFIGYERAISILNRLEYLAEQPRQTRAWGLGILAPAGSGKTMLARALVRRLSTNAKRHPEGDSRTLPVVMISMTGARESRTIDNRLLEALRAPFNSAMRLADREQLVLYLLREAKTKLLIIDEIQDVLSSTARQQRGALDHIKLLMNSLGIPVAVFGTPGAIEAMQVDPHLAARFDWETLAPWKADDETRELLQAMERSLPLRYPSNLSSITTTKLIIGKTMGTLARIVRLVNTAAIFAIHDKTERISAETLEKAMTKTPPSAALREDTDQSRV